eukprot:TRINITY_DN6224_c0_g1_i1.p1 TRINITY_DN6224_c0_g1~~TRINITY_DN6224_c0_g1_i1.p1  ORF type:complete len:289 (-),score=43.06 TRINITY_DN6224_c0_g1_i1:804-1616(-)
MNSAEVNRIVGQIQSIFPAESYRHIKDVLESQSWNTERAVDYILWQQNRQQTNVQERRNTEFAVQDLFSDFFNQQNQYQEEGDVNEVYSNYEEEEEEDQDNDVNLEGEGWEHVNEVSSISEEAQENDGGDGWESGYPRRSNFWDDVEEWWAQQHYNQMEPDFGERRYQNWQEGGNQLHADRNENNNNNRNGNHIQVDDVQVNQQQEGNNSQNTDGSKCVVCLTNAKSAGFAHDNSVHKCVCVGCCEYFRVGDDCPVCRKRIQMVVKKIYE